MSSFLHSTNNNNTNNSNNNARNNNDDDVRMSSIQSDLEDVERQLGSVAPTTTTTTTTTGRTFYTSIQTALSSIRLRLEEYIMSTSSSSSSQQLHRDEEQMTQPLNVAVASAQQLHPRNVVNSDDAVDNDDDDTPAVSCVGRLMERIRMAELALSACIPLDRLYTELSLRGSTTTTANSNNATTIPTIQSSATTTTTITTTQRPSLSSSSPSRRRTSVLSASRHNVAESSLADLHGSSSNLNNLSRHSSSLHVDNDDDNDNVEMEVAGYDADTSHDDPKRVTLVPQPPTILLTGSSMSKLDLARQSVLFPPNLQSPQDADDDDVMQIEDNDVTTTTTPPSSTTIVYSWGSSGENSLHDHGHSILDVADARVSADSPVGRADIVSVAVGEHHAAAVTQSGQVLLAGCNTAGEVDPDRRNESLITKPIFIESLSQATRIIQVSCGYNHTAALRSNGMVLTWGNNEYGQLGHTTSHNTTADTSSSVFFCRPATMALGAPGNRATSIACGDGFTLCLTTRMSVLACGIQTLSGNQQEGIIAAQPIAGLQCLPIVGIAAGRRHAVVYTAHGSAFAWGENNHGECGREYPKILSVPMPIKTPDSTNSASSSNTGGTPPPLPPPLTSWAYREDPVSRQYHVSLADGASIVDAACGSDHTVLVTKLGQLLVCGSNSHGQLGLDTIQNDVSSPQLLEHPITARKFVTAEAGDLHTLLLDNMGDVWQMSGSGGGPSDKSTRSGLKQLLVGKGVRTIGAGGGHSVAVAVRPGRQPIKRDFSDAVLKHENGDHQLANCVEEMIRALPKEENDTMDVHVNSALTKITTQAEELFRTPAVLNSLFMDPTELEDLFTKLLNVQSTIYRQHIVSAVEKGIHSGLDTLRMDDSRLIWPEQVRFLLLYMQCPMFIDYWKKDSNILFDRRGDLILALCESILGIPYEGYIALMAWATSTYTREQFVRLLLRPLHSQLQKGMSVEAGAERRPIPTIVQVLRWLYSASERAGNGAQPEDFYSDAIRHMHPTMLYKDLEMYKKAHKHQHHVTEFYFCSYPFLIAPDIKRNLLQMENEVTMFKAATASGGVTYNSADHSFEISNAFYVLEISRDNLLAETLQKIAHADANDLRKKLRVVFQGEAGVDAGGVTREYFQLLSARLFDVTSGMWSSRHFDTSVTWFNSDCSWNDEGYYLSGILVGLAVYNSVLLDVHFPQAVYRKLLALPLGLEDVVDDDIKRSLRQLLDYNGDDVEDVFCLTFDVYWVDLGQEKRRELKPNGRNIPVTSENKEEYVMLYVKWLLVESIYPQYESFEAGFARVMENSTLDILRPEELELLVVGSPVLDFGALENNTEYDGGYTATSSTVVNFWRFVQEASEESQLNLLKFTTGSTRAPIGGLGKLNFKIQRAGPDSDSLPTSHTCFNVLLLPDYGDNYEKLKERLGRAILESEGFGLQ